MEREIDKRKSPPAVPVPGLLVAVDGSVIRADDEEALDRLLAQAVPGEEPKLWIVERLLGKLRVRREV